MSAGAFRNLSVGRSSQSAASKAKLMAALKDFSSAEPVKRGNFDLAESKHTKLKIHTGKSG